MPETAPDISAPETRDENALDLGYTVSVDAFSGPLDLLLFLVRKSELDIIDIPVATIADQFVSLVSEWQRDEVLDLEVAGDFILMAATLLEIKARTIAPPPLDEGERATDDEDDILDPRADLIGKLLAYRRFKEAVGLLVAREADRALRVTRQTREDIPEDPDEAAGIDLGELHVAELSKFWHTLLVRIGGGGPRTVMKDDLPIEGSIRKLAERAAAERELTLHQLFRAEPALQGRISILMATLECTRQRIVHATQYEQYADVQLRFRPEEDRLIVPVQFPPEEGGKKRRRRPPLVTFQAPVAPTSDELEDAPEPEEKHETDEERFLRELNEACDLDGVLARVHDVEKGFQQYWEVLHPPEPKPVAEVQVPAVADVAPAVVDPAPATDAARAEAPAPGPETAIVPGAAALVEAPPAIADILRADSSAPIELPAPTEPAAETVIAAVVEAAPAAEAAPVIDRPLDAAAVATEPIGSETVAVSIHTVAIHQPTDPVAAIETPVEVQPVEVAAATATVEQVVEEPVQPAVDAASTDAASDAQTATPHAAAVAAHQPVSVIEEPVHAAAIDAPPAAVEASETAGPSEPVAQVVADLVVDRVEAAPHPIAESIDEAPAATSEAPETEPPAALVRDLMPEVRVEISSNDETAALEAIPEPAAAESSEVPQGIVSLDAPAIVTERAVIADAPTTTDMAGSSEADAVSSNDAEAADLGSIAAETSNASVVENPQAISSISDAETHAPVEAIPAQETEPTPSASVAMPVELLPQPVATAPVASEAVSTIAQESVPSGLIAAAAAVSMPGVSAAVEVPAAPATRAVEAQMASAPVPRVARAPTRPTWSRTLLLLAAGTAGAAVAGWWMLREVPQAVPAPVPISAAPTPVAAPVEAGVIPPEPLVVAAPPSAALLAGLRAAVSASLDRLSAGAAEQWLGRAGFPIAVPWYACAPLPAAPASLFAFVAPPVFTDLPVLAFAREGSWAWCAAGAWAPARTRVLPESAFLPQVDPPASLTAWAEEPDLRGIPADVFRQPTGWAICAGRPSTAVALQPPVALVETAPAAVPQAEPAPAAGDAAPAIP